MYDRIIVPVDGDGAAAPLETARLLARRLGAELTLLHVHHTIEAPAELEALPQYRYQHVVEAWDDRDAEEEARAVAWLRTLEARLGAEEPSLKVSSRVVEGALPRRLLPEGERVMVVTAAAAEAARSTTRALLSTEGVPVLVVPRESHHGPKAVRHVVVALDGSRFSEEVLGPAVELAVAFDARISLVEVVTRHAGLARLLHMSDRSAEQAEFALRAIRGRIGRRGVDVRVVEASDVARVLRAETEAVEGGVLAMATHGRGALRRLILGSVAARVLSGGTVPVLLIRPTGVPAAATVPA